MSLDIENIYKYRPLKDIKQTQQYEAILSKAKELAELIQAACPNSRERAVAFTNLETAVMWANAALERA